MTLPVLSGAGDKQGYLGELAAKSTQELKELLQRQQQLKANVKFINRLPDKGEKIIRMVEKLEAIFAERQDVDKTADMFEKMALEAETSQHERLARPDTAADSDDEEEEEGDRLKQIVNRPAKEKAVKYCNSYERVIRKAEQRPHNKGKFFPHRTVHSKDMDELEKNVDLVSLKANREKKDFDPTTGKPSEVKPVADQDSTTVSQEKPTAESSSSQQKTMQKPVAAAPMDAHEHSPHKTLQDLGRPQGCRFKHRYDDSLMETTAARKFSSVKLIDVQESADLQIKQKQQQEQIQASQAAARLAERLNIRMSSFEPEGSAALAFREQQEQEQEEDSDDAELEYPD